VEIAQEKQVVKGRKMRLDTTVVETNIHYPTDSNLLGDGVRVLIRAMKRIGEIVGQQGAKLRDRSRSVKFRILEIGRVVRTKGGPNKERLQKGYEKLLSIVGRVVGQARRFSGEIAQGVKRSADVMQQAALEGLRKELDIFVPRVQQVMRQAKQRIFGGNTHVAEKL
jgi:IS5 family transposase